MAAIEDAKRFIRSGRFSEALRALDSGRVNAAERTTAKTIRVELLERLGEYDAATLGAEELLRSKKLTAAERSSCFAVLGRVESLNGHVDAAIRWYQKAVTLAEYDREYAQACWTQFRLLLLVSEHSGIEAGASLLAEIRANATRTGDPLAMAALHVYVAQVEAKRGSLVNPRRHIRLALELLKSCPNAWLEGMAFHIDAAISAMRLDLRAAVTSAERALDLALLSGVIQSIATSQANLAHLFFATGQHARAVEFNELALRRFPNGSDNYAGVLDNLANLRLIENRVSDCEALLDQIDATSQGVQPVLRYPYRHAALTRSRLLARQGEFRRALINAENAIQLANEAADQLLVHTATLRKAEILVHLGRITDAIDATDSVAPTVSKQPPDVLGLYERTVGHILARQHRLALATSHFSRARRLYDAVHYNPGLIELKQAGLDDDSSMTASSVGDELIRAFSTCT